MLDAIDQAVAVLKQGGVVAYPTEAVYGLGCDPWDGRAVERLLALKGREAEKGLIVIGHTLPQLESLLAPVSRSMRARLERDWPGPVTWICPASRETPAWLTGGRDTIAVRVPGLATARELCRRAAMPIVSTSANPAGTEPARNALDVRQHFGRNIDYLIDTPVGNPSASPSEIRDARNGEVLRPGRSGGGPA